MRDVAGKIRGSAVALTVSLLAGLLVLAPVGMWVCGRFTTEDPEAVPISDDVDATPDPEDVKSMEAFFYELPGGVLVERHFVVPKEHYSSILASLHPCRRDKRTPKWVVFGELRMTLRDNKQFDISLYLTYGRVGAFSSARGYYRGGTDKVIEDAVRAASAR
jgi:hypothetical protein